MKKLKNDLKAVTKRLKALSMKTEQMAKEVAGPEKAQAAKKRKAKATTKTRKAPSKKKVARKAVAKKKAPARRKAVAKKPTRTAVTATDQVLKLIKGSKKGVDVPALMKKTGFDEKKVRNIVSRAFKQKTIKRPGRGLYVAA